MERVIKFENLKKIAKENNYNHVCLISPEGVKMVNFNPANNKTTFDQNLVKIERKLKSHIYSPGKYKILLCERISRGMEPDEFYIYKGTQLNENTPTTTTTQPQVIIRETAQPFERALTFEKAIELNGELANLRAERLYLLQQITELQETVNELEQELENSNLSEGPQQNTFVDTLKEYAPSIMAYLDKSLQIKERELSERKPEPAPMPKQQKVVIPGSNDHLRIIETLIARKDYLNLERQLNKIKDVNEDLYYIILEKYNLQTEQPQQDETND